MKRILRFFGLYTKADLVTMIKRSSGATVTGVFDYCNSPHVFITNDAGRRIDDARITTDEDKEALTDFVYARLNEVGIGMVKN